MDFIKKFYAGVFVLGILINNPAYSGQSLNRSDLHEMYNRSVSDTARYNKALELAQYYETISPDSALTWYHQAKDIAKLIDRITLAKSYQLIGEYYLNLTERDSSAFYLEKALQIFEAENMTDQVMLTWEQLSDIYQDLGEYYKTLDITLKQLDANRRTGDKAKIARSYQDLGYLYYFMGDYALTYKYYSMAMDLYLAENLLYEYNINRYYSALMYFEIGDYETCESILKDALPFFKKYESDHEDGISYTATIYKRLALLDIETGKYNEGIIYCDSAFTLLKDGPSIGWVYAHLGALYTRMNNFEKATENFQLSKKYVPDCNSCFWPVYTDISEYFLHFNMPDSAIYYCNITLDRAVTFRYDIRILRTYKVLANAYEAIGDHANAYKFSQEYNELYQSALSKRKLAMLKNEEHKAASSHIEKLESENQMFSSLVGRQKFMLVILFSLVIILILFIILVYKSHKQKQRLMEQSKEIAVIKSRIEGQEEERARIARELHDGIAADLTGVRMNLVSQAKGYESTGPVNVIIDRIAQIGNEVRAISHNLSSPVFSDTTLEEVIEGFILQFTGKNELEINLNIYPRLDWNKIDFKIQKELYRVFQEVVNNTIKYSQASELMVQIVKHDNYLSLIFEDNGKGFNPEAKSGTGLSNIKERIQSLNGEIDISSEIGKGCSISIEVPLIIEHELAAL